MWFIIMLIWNNIHTLASASEHLMAQSTNKSPLKLNLTYF